MSARRSLKIKGKKDKKYQNISFVTQNRIITTGIRIKIFDMPIFCFVKWTVQYKQSTFEFLEVTINEKVANFQNRFKVGLSPSKKNYAICLIESPLKIKFFS